MSLRIGSLFSGIGMLELGLEWAGVGRVAWQVEREPFPLEVLARHWPDATRYTDVREVRGGSVEPVDVLCGGFPCQDVSNAGKRAGLDGERSGLWWEFHRIVDELRPAIVVVENVAALLSRGGPDVLRSLAALGYDAWWDCLPASACGAAHRRDRLFIVAWRSVGDGKCERLEGEHDVGAAARAAFIAGRARVRRQTQPGLGGTADGGSAGVDAVMWPTPRAADGRPKGRACGKIPSLETVAMMWPTPSASCFNDSEDVETWEARREFVKARRPDSGNGFGEPLTIAVRRQARPIAAWEGDTPRTIPVPLRGSPEAARRKARLKALGNSVDLRVATVIGHVVAAVATSTLPGYVPEPGADDERPTGGPSRADDRARPEDGR